MSDETSVRIALTVAGSDSSGGAGIQADLKTFAMLGVYGASVVTALTAQNTLGVQAVRGVAPEFVRQQMNSVLSDLDVRAAKTGMLADEATIEAVVAGFARHPVDALVVDPVMVATSGDTLLEPGAVDTLKARMIPLATLLTPNIAEAALLLGGAEADSIAKLRDQAERLMDLGPGAVLVKGGHLPGKEAVDVFFDGETMCELAEPRVDSPHTHGTGCTLSAAIAAGLAQEGDLLSVVRAGKQFVTGAIRLGKTARIGHGRGPLDHVGAGLELRRRHSH